MSITAKAGILIALAATSGFLLQKYSRSEQTADAVSPAIHEAFQKWSVENKRLYGTPSELNYRLNVFAQNYLNVQEEKTKVSHEVGLTIFADLTKEEFLTKYTGFLGSPSENIKSDEETIVEKFTTAMPEVSQGGSVDHRKTGLSTPVKNQKSCGSCWAFSAIASFEGAWIKAKQYQTTFSEQQLVDCSRSYGNNGCRGGWMSKGFQYLKDNGSMTETDYPYMAVDQACNSSSSKFKGKVTKFVDLPRNDAVALKNAVNQNIVSVAVDANTWFTYKSGIIRGSDCKNSLNHGVVIVGYGVENGVKFWIVKNSWGNKWGEDGYLRVEDSSDNGGAGACGINMINSYVEIAAPF